MVSDVRNALGGMWEGGERVPPPPGGEKKIWPSFGYEEGPRVRRLLRLETEEGLGVRRLATIMDDDLLERAARRPAATASSLQLHALLHRHPLMNRSGSARGRHGLGRAITFHSAGAMLLSKHPQHVYLAAAAALAAITAFFRPLQIHWKLYHLPQSRGSAHLQVSSVAAQRWWVRVASKWISSNRSSVEGCDPGSSLGHAHPHGGATTSSASFNGRRGKPFPRARRHCCCSPCTCWPCACCVLTYV